MYINPKELCSQNTEAHMKDGQEGLATELYKRLLKLNPENEYAAEKLRQLE